MFIFEAYKLYQLKKIDIKTNKLKQKKESLIKYLTNINMMPVKYNDGNSNVKSNVTADVVTNNDNEAADVDSNVKPNVTADVITNNDNEAADVDSNVKPNVTAVVVTNNDNEAADVDSNVTADVVTNNDNEAADVNSNVKSTEIDIRIVSVNFEEEHAMVQHGYSIQKIEASTSILEKLPLGENVTLKINSDDTIEFFKKGNKVA